MASFVFLITYLLVSVWLSHDFWYLQITDKNYAKTPHRIFSQKCVSVVSLQNSLFSIFLGEDAEKL